ncbi:MAG: hypothetical protein Ct9H300mP1_17280 [Planctomycetaceae bacterium]|nr:MAG: hypothetical protein Ct9H300mP1_17280 [Planctomycetaceae bacterium]
MNQFLARLKMLRQRPVLVTRWWRLGGLASATGCGSSRFAGIITAC